MIDQISRDKLQSLQTAKVISDGIDKLASAIKGGKGEGGTMVLANEFRELQKVLNQEALDKLKGIIGSLDEKIGSLSDLEKNLPRKLELNFPKVYPVTGSVEVSKLPSVTIGNAQAIAKELAPLISNLTASTFKAMSGVRLAMPSSISIKDSVEIKNWSDLVDGFEELKKGFNLLLNKEVGAVSFPSAVLPVEIQNWKVPNPVTNVSINPSRGTIMATAVTVTTALTPLPGTALADRRSMTIYNNGSVTIYVGGSNVTSATGMPVPAGTYGPSLDAGPLNIVYAVTASSSSDIRILGMNDTMEGGDA